MRNGVLAAAVLVLTGSGPIFAQAGAKAAIEKTLIANETKVNDAVMKHDVATFNSLVAGDAVSADMGGFMKVADFVKSFDQVKIATWHMMSPQVIWADDKTALVTYTWMGKATYMNQPMPEMVYASTVWTDRNGKWMAVFHQETGAALTPPPKK
jgi:hypothetical protein